MWDAFEIGTLFQRYRKNTLTHGAEFLRGDDEIPLFAPNAVGQPSWRPIPSNPMATLSRASISTTTAGNLRLNGFNGGARAGLQMLSGEVDLGPEAKAIGVGLCGMASTARWQIELDQHHWLELRLRTDGRQYELVLQSDGRLEGSHWIFRADIPRGPPPPRLPAAGPYAALGLEADASADEIREAYVKLAKKMHPDAGGSEEHFKRLSRAYTLLSDPERRERYDAEGADDADDSAEAAELGEWRDIKMPFTAFKDPSFYDHHHKIGHMYILLREEEVGPFRLELGGIKAGRCENGFLPGAGFRGSTGCEMGHCECGYYNGWRVEGFEGPLSTFPPPKGSIEFGYAEHHGEYRGE